MTPYFCKLLRDIELVFPDLAELDFVIEVHAEEASMVVGTLCLVPVFAAGVIPERTLMVAKAFEEFCQMCPGEAAVLGQMLVRICERDEAIAGVCLRLVYTAHSPLAAFFEPAAGALAAWEFDGGIAPWMFQRRLEDGRAPRDG